MKEERYYLNPLIITAGAKKWFRETAWKFYSKASKERNKNLRYVDPFCGGLSIPLFILPENAWLNDGNKYLINFYKYITTHGSMKDFSAKNTDKDFYYQQRDRFNEKIRNNELDAEMAEIFYYLNRAGYGGLSRYNSKGEYNVPFRGHISNARTDFSAEMGMFETWEFSSLDFLEVLDKVKEDDFLFIDPPYDETFNKYIQAGFSWDQQVILAEKLAELSNPIVATNSATDRIVELYTNLGFDVQFRMRGNFIQRPKVKNGVHKDFKEAVFTKNIRID